MALAAACAQTLNPPTAVATVPATWHVGVPLQLDGTKSTAFARAAPTPTPPLRFHWSFLGVPPRSTAKLNDPALAQPSFTPDAPGAYTLQLFVDDGVFASPPVSATVSVGNDCAPQISSFKAVAAPAVGDTVVLGANTATPCAGGDAAGDTIVGWSWSFASVPPGSRAQIAQANSSAASFVADVRGDYDVVLVVTDSLGLSSDPSDPKSHLKITSRLCGDNPPVVASLAASPTAPDVLQAVALSAVVTDADIDSCGLKRALSYSWQLTAVPSGSRAQLNNAAVKAPSFTPDVRGDYLVALTVTDDLGRKSGRQTLTVSTSACGSAIPQITPQVTTPASGNISVGQLVQLGVGVLDTDNPGADGGLNPVGFDGGPSDGGSCSLGLTFSYNWTLVTAPQGSRVQINGGLANPSFKPDVFGSYVFSVVVTASTGKASAPAFVSVQVVNCGSLAPVAAVTAPAGWITGRALGAPDLASTITDANGTGTCTLGTAPYQYAWSLVQVPPGSNAALSGTGLSGTSAQTTPSFTPDVAGAYTLGLVVTDSLGLSSAQATAQVTVGACNVPINVGAPTVKAGALITGQPLQFTSVVTDLNDPGSTPGLPSAGACQTPVFPLTYAWALVDQPQGSAAQLSSANTAAPSLTPDKTGSYGLVLVVIDAAGNRGLSQKATFNVATPCNAPPSVAITVTTSPAVTGLPVALLATPNDAANTPSAGGCVAQVTPFSYAWTLAGQPAGSKAALNNVSAANPSFVPDVAGDYSLVAVVTDAAGNKSAPTPFTVTVSTVCTAPISAVIAVNGNKVAPFNVSAGVPVLLSATVSDPNAPSAGGCQAATTPYSYVWSLVALPSGSKAALNNRNAATPSFTPDLAAGNASYSVQVAVVDAAGNKSPTVQVDLNTPAASSCSQAPSVSGMTFNTAGSSNVTNNPVTLGVTASNPNPAGCYTGGATAALNYQWSLVARPPNSGAQITDPFATAPKYTPDALGTYVVSVRVNDANGNATTLNGTSPAVTRCGSAFTVAATVQGSPTEIGQSVGLSALVTDNNAAACGLPSVAPFSYAWLLTPPAGSTSAVLSNDRSSRTSFTPDVAGSYNYAVSVTDAAGVQVSVASAAATATLPVDVRNCTLTPSITPAGPTTGLNVGTLQALTGSYTVNAGCGGLYTGFPGANPLPVRWQWSFDTVPAGSNAFLSNQNGPGSGFTLDRPGTTSTWVVRLTVQDALSGASSSATSSFSASACGTATIAGYAGIFLGPVCGGAACTQTGTANGTAVPHACPPNATGTCTGAVTPDVVYTVGTTALPYSLELFAGDVTASTATTTKASAGSPNAACGGFLSYSWTPYQVPPGSTLSNFNGFGPGNAAQPGAKLDVKGDYVFQLFESDQIGGSPFGGGSGGSSLPAKQATTYLWIQVK